MSWDRFDYDETAKCACGQGTVIKHCYQEDDDWNRSRYGITGYDINCPTCKAKYHVDSITRHYPCPSWDGTGIVTKEYLVPNDMDLPKVINPTYIQTYTVDADIASKFSETELSETIDDMQTSKFSTQVQLSSSKAIIDICSKRMKIKSLNKIIPLLQDILKKYDSYKWNPKTVADFKRQEQQAIDANEKEIERVVNSSFELMFRRM